MTQDFSLEKYDELCQAIKKVGCPVMTLSDFINSGQPQKLIIVLRHDVDRCLGSAMRMAKYECDQEIRSTYYLRKIDSVFKEKEIRLLHQFGHEVGYHYEVMIKARGQTDVAAEIFVNELGEFRKLVPISTVSMHGSPLHKWNNLDFWNYYELADFDLLGDASVSIDYSKVYYFTDTGRQWGANRYNIRDRVNSIKLKKSLHTSNELITFLFREPKRPVIINVHPNRWTTNIISWSLSAVSDWTINQAKWMISKGHQLRI